MCGRFTLTAENREWVAQHLGVDPEQLIEEYYRPRWNIAPTQEHWIVRNQREEREAVWATWGLVNWWDENRRAGAKHINARAESLAKRRPFRDAFKTARCIVPADGFFEWVGEKKERRPIWFHRPDREPFLFAGLYASARLEGEAERTTTFTIITTEPNETVRPIHDRMPVILPTDEAIEAWLFDDQPPEALRGLMTPIADEFLVPTAVSTRVNSVDNDDAACLDEAEQETQGALI